MDKFIRLGVFVLGLILTLFAVGMYGYHAFVSGQPDLNEFQQQVLTGTLLGGILAIFYSWLNPFKS